MSKFLAQTQSKAGTALAVSAALISTGPAVAQTLEEVIVVATKREQGVMDVPLAITALSGDFIEDTNLNDVKDLISYTPGVSGNSQDSYIDAVSIRVFNTGLRCWWRPVIGIFQKRPYEGRNGSAVTSLSTLSVPRSCVVLKASCSVVTRSAVRSVCTRAKLKSARMMHLSISTLTARARGIRRCGKYPNQR